ncbi:MAG: tetraacyldisaccharide 4'-kinase [Chlorobiaceae bacterium]|nr:tetraacyldisaccharide 4'-kinase [Chlorobiaceae bacterium]
MPDRLAASLLSPAGLAYGVIMKFRNNLYDQGIFKAWRSPIPVVSIGNITTGGTGKTPLVDWIVRFYRENGIAPAIISRGYGRSTKGALVVSDGSRMHLGSREAGDEVAMLAARNPSTIVIVAEKRQEGVELLMREFPGRLPDVIVLDDAFQHRKIARDLDIVVINASEPLTDARMLPAGHLREPLSGLGRADLFILSKITSDRNAAAIVQHLKPFGKPVVLSKVCPGKPVRVQKSGDDMHGAHGTRVLAFAGIGAPESFLRSLREAGMEVVSSHFFRDHQPYTRESVAMIVSESEKLGVLPVTTEKDWFRIQDNQELTALLYQAGCAYLPIEQQFIEGQSSLEKSLLDLLNLTLHPAAGQKQVH